MALDDEDGDLAPLSPAQLSTRNFPFTGIPCPGDLLESLGWRENTSQIFGSKGFVLKI